MGVNKNRYSISTSEEFASRILHDIQNKNNLAYDFATWIDEDWDLETAIQRGEAWYGIRTVDNPMGRPRRTLICSYYGEEDIPNIICVDPFGDDSLRKIESMIRDTAELIGDEKMLVEYCGME